VIEQRQIAALIDQANAARRRHDWPTAINLLKRALALDPEHGIAHATLALTLLAARRLHAAVIECDLALAFEGNHPFAHYTAAAVKHAERKLDAAWEHMLVALQDDSADADTHVLAARIRKSQGELDAAHTLLTDALALDADHVAARVALVYLELQRRQLGEAARHAEHALEIDPSDGDAHIAAGYVALAKGDVSTAEQHARFALNQDAGDRDAMQLFTAVKARRNLVLGLWWRFSAFVSFRSERGRLAMLIGSFLVVRLVIIALGALGYEDAEMIVARIWTAFCAYTWFAPAIFDWMLKRELGTVRLRSDF
jgi:tetratricopeptide (TPR) repeat protein